MPWPSSFSIHTHIASLHPTDENSEGTLQLLLSNNYQCSSSGILWHGSISAIVKWRDYNYVHLVNAKNYTIHNFKNIETNKQKLMYIPVHWCQSHWCPSSHPAGPLLLREPYWLCWDQKEKGRFPSGTGWCHAYWRWQLVSLAAWSEDSGRLYWMLSKPRWFRMIVSCG